MPEWKTYSKEEPNQMLFFDEIKTTTEITKQTQCLLDINDFLLHSSPRDIHYHQGGFPLQWSAAVGLGMEFKLTPGIGLYLDPSFRYYFGTENQPRSIRTIQPLRVDLEAGVRFSL